MSKFDSKHSGTIPVKSGWWKREVDTSGRFIEMKPTAKKSASYEILGPDGVLRHRISENVVLDSLRESTIKKRY